jgi:hypothetical protein
MSYEIGEGHLAGLGERGDPGVSSNETVRRPEKELRG